MDVYVSRLSNYVNEMDLTVGVYTGEEGAIDSARLFIKNNPDLGFDDNDIFVEKFQVDDGNFTLEEEDI